MNETLPPLLLACNSFGYTCYWLGVDSSGRSRPCLRTVPRGLRAQGAGACRGKSKTVIYVPRPVIRYGYFPRPPPPRRPPPVVVVNNQVRFQPCSSSSSSLQQIRPSNPAENTCSYPCFSPPSNRGKIVVPMTRQSPSLGHKWAVGEGSRATVACTEPKYKYSTWTETERLKETPPLSFANGAIYFE